MRLYTTISGTDQLSPRDQAALVAQLQWVCEKTATMTPPAAKSSCC